jgi:hypothetical protein
MKSIKEVDKDGTIRYMNINGDLHREDGPAYEHPNGAKAWWKDGRVHREDGPARIWPDGDLWYYLKGKSYTKEEWEVQVVKLKLKRIKDL